MLVEIVWSTQMSDINIEMGLSTWQSTMVYIPLCLNPFWFMGNVVCEGET